MASSFAVAFQRLRDRDHVYRLAVLEEAEHRRERLRPWGLAVEVLRVQEIRHLDNRVAIDEDVSRARPARSPGFCGGSLSITSGGSPVWRTGQACPSGVRMPQQNRRGQVRSIPRMGLLFAACGQLPWITRIIVSNGRSNTRRSFARIGGAVEIVLGGRRAGCRRGLPRC